MSNGQESLTRSENKRRDQRKQKSKVDKILNILIAVVSILIVLNVVTIFSDNETDKISEKDQAIEKQNENNNQENEDTNTESNEVVAAQETDSQEEPYSENSAELIVESSDDPMVEEVMINPEWEVTPTEQTGEHVSAYQSGHIDYEEKLETFRNAVQLDESEIIFWSVKNNGSTESAVAVVSTKDKSENYRIYIEWIENQGWIPVKVEKLNQTIGAR